MDAAFIRRDVSEALDCDRFLPARSLHVDRLHLMVFGIWGYSYLVLMGPWLFDSSVQGYNSKTTRGDAVRSAHKYLSLYVVLKAGYCQSRLLARLSGSSQRSRCNSLQLQRRPVRLLRWCLWFNNGTGYLRNKFSHVGMHFMRWLQPPWDFARSLDRSITQDTLCFTRLPSYIKR